MSKRPDDPTLVDLLRDRADRRGDTPAYTFLEDGEIEASRLTDSALDRRARAVAAALRAEANPGDRAILLYPAGLDFLEGLFGCLYAGVIGIPTPPPEASRLKRTAPRLGAIAADARASIVLTTSKIREMIERAEASPFGDAAIRWVATDRIDDGPADDWREPEISGESLAYLQYTSGSTSSPKGVMIAHRNLIHHADQLRRDCGYGPESVTVTWMPNFHDYGLVEGLLEPLFNATPCYVMSPFAFVKRPESWLRAITRYRATHSQAPNFAYDLCVRRIPPDRREGLDLSSWRAAGNAAELINPAVLAAFQVAFGPHGFHRTAFRPAYGLAEATLLVSSSPLDEEPVVVGLRAPALEAHRLEAATDDEGTIREVSGCGRALAGTRVEIVDPETRTRCAPDRIGEIWVAGPAVAGGYWGRDEETERTFRATLADTGEGPFLRTGDLGFLMHDRLFIAGRIKDLVIIRGSNHHPQDIEWTVQGSHPALRPEAGAAFSVMIDGEERLVVVQEVERAYAASIQGEGIARVARRAIAESHDLDLFALLLLSRGSLPRTASGKIQRQACRDFFLRGGPQVLAHWVAPTRDAVALPAWLSATPATAGPASDNGSATPAKESAMKAAPSAADFSRARADELIGWLRGYAADRINSRLMDERRCIPPYILLDFGERGLMGMQVPESHGGLGLRYADALRVLEQLAAIDLTLAAVVFLNGTNGIRPIQGYARPALRDELLPKLAAGRMLASFALSEPAAGSNLGGIATVARPDGRGGWRLRGLKRWNSSSWAGVVSVFARMVDDRGRSTGLTGFVVRQGAPGLRIGPEALTMGLRASVQNSLFLDDVPVGPEQVLGEPGRGMEVAEDALTIGRLCIASVCLGGMKRCAQLIARYGSRRTVASGRLVDHPLALAALGEMSATIDALEALKDQIADRLDAGHTVPAEVPMAAKVLGSDAMNGAAAQLMQWLGGRGYMENNLAPQILRDARLFSVGEGPNEPLTTQVGRKARHTSAIADYLEADRDGAEVHAVLAAAVPEIADRWISRPGPFADRAAAQLWAEGRIGRVTNEALLLAATRAAHRRSPSPRLRRALEWAEGRFASALRDARDGRPEDRLIPTGPEVDALVAGYVAAIGDVEQTLAGEEEDLDAYLRRRPGHDAYPAEPTLPGHAEVTPDAAGAGGAGAGPAESPEVRAKRARLAGLLRQRLESAAPTSDEP